jgi:hypothetical protein
VATGPKLGEREGAQELVEHAMDGGTLRKSVIMLAYKGLAGRDIERFTADELGVLLARPDRRDERKRRFGSLGGMRQWIAARPRCPREASRRPPPTASATARVPAAATAITVKRFGDMKESGERWRDKSEP